MKKLLIAAAVSTSIALTGCAPSGQSLDPNRMTMNKQLVVMEHGVVLMAEGVEVVPSELNKGTQIGAGVAAAGLGTAAYGGVSGNNTAAGAGAAVALVGLAAMAISEHQSNQPVPAIRYTIQVMETGKMDEVIQAIPENKPPFAENAPVLIKRYSDGTKFLFADLTQGKVFKRAEATRFEGDAAKEAKANAKLAKEQEHADWLREQEKRRIEAETSRQEVISDRTNDKIDADIRASDNISEGIKGHGFIKLN